MSMVEDERLNIDTCWKRIGIWGSRDCEELSVVMHCSNCKVYARVGRLLLDRRLPDEYIHEPTELLAQKKKQRTGSSSVFLFRIGSEWFALSTTLLVEVLEERPVHSVPHYSGQILQGLANVRGKLQLCVSLAKLLEVECAIEDKDQKRRMGTKRMVMVCKDTENLVFPVSEAYGVHRYHLDDILNTPATLGKVSNSYIKGILEWDNMHVSILEETLLFEHITRSLS